MCGVHLGLSASGMIAYTLFLYEALRHTSALDASLINAVTPAVIAGVAVVLLRDRTGPRAPIGVLLGLAGVLIVLTEGRLTAVLDLDVNPGNALMLGAVAVWSLYTIAGRRLAGSPPIASTAVQVVLAVVVLSPVALWSGADWPEETVATVSLVFIGIFPSVGACLLWNMALRAVPAGRAGVFLDLITVFTAAIGLVLRESLSWEQVAGGALVFGGIALVSTGPTRARARTAPAADHVSGEDLEVAKAPVAPGGKAVS